MANQICFPDRNRQKKVPWKDRSLEEDLSVLFIYIVRSAKKIK